MFNKQCHLTRKRLSSYILDSIRLQIQVLLSCESLKYVAKLFSLSIVPVQIEVHLLYLAHQFLWTRPMHRQKKIDPCDLDLYLRPASIRRASLSSGNSCYNGGLWGKSVFCRIKLKFCSWLYKKTLTHILKVSAIQNK